MAKDKRAPGAELPLSQVTQRIKGRVIIYTKGDTRIAQSWPRPTKKPPSDAVLEQRQEFKALVQATKSIPADQATAARDIAQGSKYTWRDVMSLVMVGKLIVLDNYGEVVSQYNLDILGDQPGDIVIRSAEWIALHIGGDGQVLTIVAGLPAWQDATSGLNQLTGDVTAGPGTGSQAATLAASGVTPGAYTAANITVDSKGRVTAAANSGATSGLNQLTGDVTAGPGTGTQAATLAASGVMPGTYIAANIIVDSKGRVTAAASSGATSGLNQLTGDVTAGPGTGTQAATLAASGVTPGTYTAANVTVDIKGRITAAASGTPGTIVTSGGGVTTLNTNITPASIINNTSEQDLITYTLPANTLNTNGKRLRIRAGGTYGAASNNRTARLYFGASVLTLIAANNGQIRWWFDIDIVRTASGAQQISGIGYWGAAVSAGSVLAFNFQAAETDTGAITIKISGQQSTAAGINFTATTLNIDLMQ